MVGSVLSSVFFLVLLTMLLSYEKLCQSVMGGFICRPFRGNSRSRNFGLLVNQIFYQNCERQADSGCSCLRSTLYCCSSPEAERSSIQHVSVCSPRSRLICFINFQETVCVIPADNWIYPPLVSEPAAFLMRTDPCTSLPLYSLVIVSQTQFKSGGFNRENTHLPTVKVIHPFHLYPEPSGTNTACIKLQKMFIF